MLEGKVGVSRVEGRVEDRVEGQGRVEDRVEGVAESSKEPCLAESDEVSSPSRTRSFRSSRFSQLYR